MSSMTWSYTWSPTYPAIPSLHRALNIGKPDRIIGEIRYRLASLEDVSAIAIVATRVLRFSPPHIVRYPSCTEAEHQTYMGDVFRRAILSELDTVFIAIDQSTGDVLGYLVFGRMRHGAADEPKTSTMRLPARSNMGLDPGYSADATAWEEEVLRDYGAHYVGRYLGVDPDGRKEGIATALCLILAHRAEKSQLPCFFVTAYYSMPFYDHFCEKHGFATRLHSGPVFLDKQKTLCIYRFQIVKRDPAVILKEREEAEERSRPVYSRADSFY